MYTLVGLRTLFAIAQREVQRVQRVAVTLSPAAGIGELTYPV